MTGSPKVRCGYTYPTDFEIDDRPIHHQHCCYRQTLPDADRCVWHVDPAATSYKNSKKLKSARSSQKVQAQTSPLGELLDGADLSGLDISDDICFANASLREADFSETNFSLADLSGADLRGSNFSGAYLAANDFTEANLNFANLSDTYLRAADFSNAELMSADLSGSDLQGANFTEGNLVVANLSETDLKGANLTVSNFRGANLAGTDLRATDVLGAQLQESDLSEADLRKSDFTDSVLVNTDLSNVVVDRTTQIAKLPESKILRLADHTWDDIAKSYHNIKRMYSKNGLTSRARNHQFRKRRARRKEAWAEGGRDYFVWLGSLLSWLITGYGIKLKQPIILIFVVLLISTGIYSAAGISHSLYYSIVTFTTSPPSPPPRGGLAEGVAMIETFIGTLLIVLLGYVLGSREQV